VVQQTTSHGRPLGLFAILMVWSVSDRHAYHEIIAAEQPAPSALLAPEIPRLVTSVARRYLQELLAHPGVEEELTLRSEFGIMAFHGGNLEAYTDHIAVETAARCDASLYVVRQPRDFRWHVPSTRFRPEESSRLRAFCNHVRTVITLHGFRRRHMPHSILLGGHNRTLASVVSRHLRRTLPEYVVEDSLEAIPIALRGLKADNPVNIPADRGVQIELPPTIRHQHEFWSRPTFDPSRSDHEAKRPAPVRLVDGLAEAVRSYRAVPDILGSSG